MPIRFTPDPEQPKIRFTPDPGQSTVRFTPEQPKSVNMVARQRAELNATARVEPRMAVDTVADPADVGFVQPPIPPIQWSVADIGRIPGVVGRGVRTGVIKAGEILARGVQHGLEYAAKVAPATRDPFSPGLSLPSLPQLNDREIRSIFEEAETIPGGGGRGTEAVFAALRIPDMLADVAQAKNEELQGRTPQYKFRESPIAYIAGKVSEQLPIMGVAVGAGILGGAGVGLAVMGFGEFGSAAEQQAQAGASINKQTAIGVLSGAAEIGGEMLVFPKILKGIKGGGFTVRQIVDTMFLNAKQESVTGFAQQFLQTYGTETSKGTGILEATQLALEDGFAAMPENAWVGFLTAGATTTSITAAGKTLDMLKHITAVKDTIENPQIVDIADIDTKIEEVQKDESIPDEQKKAITGFLGGIIGNWETKLIDKFPGEITDLKSLEEWGNKIAKELGVDVGLKILAKKHGIGSNIVWQVTDRQLVTKDAHAGGPEIGGRDRSRFHIKIFNFTRRVTEPELWAENDLKKLIIHELGHFAQRPYWKDVSGRVHYQRIAGVKRRVHGRLNPEFESWVDASVKNILTPQETKTFVPVPIEEQGPTGEITFAEPTAVTPQGEITAEQKGIPPMIAAFDLQVVPWSKKEDARVTGAAFLLDDGTIIKGATTHLGLVERVPKGRTVLDSGFIDENGNYLKREDVLKSETATGVALAKPEGKQVMSARDALQTLGTPNQAEIDVAEAMDNGKDPVEAYRQYFIDEGRMYGGDKKSKSSAMRIVERIKAAQSVTIPTDTIPREEVAAGQALTKHAKDSLTVQANLKKYGVDDIRTEILYNFVDEEWAQEALWQQLANEEAKQESELEESGGADEWSRAQLQTEMQAEANKLQARIDAVTKKPAPQGEIAAEKAPAMAEKTKPSKKRLLAEGHKIRREYNVSDKDYRSLAKKITGKRSMGKMSVKKMVAFVDALREKYGPVSGLTEEDFGKWINFEGKYVPIVPIIVELAKETETLPTKKLPKRVVSGGLGRGIKKFGVGFWRIFAGMRGSRPGRLVNIFGGLKENSMWLRVFRNGLIEGPANIRSALNKAYLEARWRFQEENGIDSKLLAKVSRTQQYWPGPVEVVQEIAGHGPDKIDITLNGQIYSETRAGLASWYFQIRQPEGMAHAVLHGFVFDDVHTGPISEEQLQTAIIEVAEADPWIVKEINWIDNIAPYYFRDPINNVSQRRVGKDIATKEHWYPLDVFKTPKVGKLGFQLKQPKETYNFIVDQSILQPRKGPGGALIRGDYFDTLEAVKEGVFEYVAYSEAYDLAHTILSHQGITDTLYAKGYGPALKYLNEIIDNEVASQGPRGPIDNALSYLTRGGVRGLIHFNPKTAAIQVSSTGMFLKDTSAKYFAAGAKYAVTHRLKDSFKIVPWMADRWYNDRGPLMIGGSAERFGLTLQQQGKLSLNMKGAWGVKVTDQFPFHVAVGTAIAEYEDYVAGKLDPESTEGKYWVGKPIVKTESLQWNGLIVDRFTVLRRGQQSYDKFDRSANTSAKDIVSRTAFLFQSFHEGAKNVIQMALDTLFHNGWSAKNVKIAARQIGPVLSSYAVEQMIRKSVGVAMFLGVGAVLRRKYKMDRWYMWPLEAITSAFDMIPIFGHRITGTIANFTRLLMKDKPVYAGKVGQPLPLQMVDTMVQGSDNMVLAMAYYLGGNTDKGEKALIRGLGGIYEGVGLSQGMPVYQVKQFQTQLEDEETGRPGIRRIRRGQRRSR